MNNYLCEIMEHQRVYHSGTGQTMTDVNVIHVIDVDGEQWGCTFPTRRHVLTKELATTKTIYSRDVDGNIHTAQVKGDVRKAYVPVMLEGAGWMSVHRVSMEETWVKDDGTDATYMENLLSLGIISANDVLFTRKNRKHTHVNSIPVEEYTPIQVTYCMPKVSAHTILLQLSDGLDDEGRAWFVSTANRDYAMQAVRKVAPHAALVHGSSKGFDEKRYTLGYFVVAVDALAKKPRKTRK